MRPGKTCLRGVVGNLLRVVPHLFGPCQGISNLGPCGNRWARRFPPIVSNRRCPGFVTVRTTLLFKFAGSSRGIAWNTEIRERVKVSEQIGGLRRIERRPDLTRFLRAPHSRAMIPQ